VTNDRAGHRDLIEEPRLGEVVGDQRLEGGVGGEAFLFELALDEIAAPALCSGVVGDAYVFWRGCGVAGCRLWAGSAGRAGFFLGWCAVLVGGGVGSRSEGP
jgi:hypothetical protein